MKINQELKNIHMTLAIIFFLIFCLVVIISIEPNDPELNKTFTQLAEEDGWNIICINETIIGSHCKSGLVMIEPGETKGMGDADHWKCEDIIKCEEYTLRKKSGD